MHRLKEFYAAELGRPSTPRRRIPAKNRPRGKTHEGQQSINQRPAFNRRFSRFSCSIPLSLSPLTGSAGRPNCRKSETTRPACYRFAPTNSPRKTDGKSTDFGISSCKPIGFRRFNWGSSANRNCRSFRSADAISSGQWIPCDHVL